MVNNFLILTFTAAESLLKSSSVSLMCAGFSPPATSNQHQPIKLISSIIISLRIAVVGYKLA